PPPPVLGREAAGEHDPALRRLGALEVLGIVHGPLAVDDLRDLAAAPEQDAFARPVAVLPRVELDEVGAVVGDLADVNRDRKHRVGNRKDGRCPARRLLREHEAREVGPGLRGDGDVLLAGQPADLDQRACDQLLQLRRGRRATPPGCGGGSAPRISVEPTSTASAPASSASAACARAPIALSATTTRSRGAASTSASCARRSVWNVERARALIPITAASSSTERRSSSASWASTRTSSPRPSAVPSSSRMRASPRSRSNRHTTSAASDPHPPR